jgi:amino acid adenylation domain-containing protein
MKTLDRFLGELRQYDVQLWVENDRLRYRAAKNSLTAELLTELKTRKVEIIQFLDRANASSEQIPPIVSIDRQGQLPLSFAQQRFWFLHQFEPDSSSNNMPVVLRFVGALDVAVLEQSCQNLLQRHEVLRTHFPSVDGQPTQVIVPNIDLTLPVIDLQQLPLSQRDAEALRIATDEARRPFNLTIEPPLRLLLIQLSDREHLLLWNMHCTICDGASADIFYRDLTALYAAFIAGKPSPLPELGLQYVDFAHWQRQWLQGEVLESQLSYWKQNLAGILPTIQLPTDRPRPPIVQTYRGDRCARMLPKSFNADLTSLSQELGGTLFMTLIATFEILLHRYSHQNDILISFASAGRGQVETEGLIGFFSNTLIQRINFDGNPTFRELFDRVRAASLEAYSRQDLPFEKLLEELSPEQNQSRSPLFQVKFALNPPWSNGRGMASVQLPDLNITSLFGYIYHGKTKYDLTLVMREQDEGLGYVFDYNADIFEASTIERMLDHFQNLLAGILANPDCRVSELPLLSLAEQQQLLPGGAKTPTAGSEHLFVHRVFEDRVAKTPTAVAVVDDRTQLTYQELNSRANRLAHYLKSIGVMPSTPVGMCLGHSATAIVALLGILKAGGICVPIDPTATGDRIDKILEDAGSTFLVTQSTIVGGKPAPTENRVASNFSCSCAKSIDLDRDWDNIQHQPQTSLAIEFATTQPAYILYPSAPATPPIGVSILHGGIVQLATSVAEIRPTTTDVLLQLSCLSSEVALLEIWGALLNGASVVMLPANSSAPADVKKVLHHQQVTIAWLPTRLLHQIAIDRLEDLRSLRQIYVNGDALSPNVVAKLNRDLPACQLIHAYSVPENTGLTCYNLDPTVTSTQGSMAIGRAIAGTQTFILDRYCQPVPIGVIGDLYLGGDRLSSGYFNRPELNERRFIAHPFSSHPAARLYQTGDLARYLVDGSIELVGQMVMSGSGSQVEVRRVETALSQHPDVWESVVLSQPDAADRQQLVAYVVPQLNHTPTITELSDFLKQKVAATAMPSAYVMLTVLPIAADGTIATHALPLPDLCCQPESTIFVAAQDELENQLIEIWETTLNIGSIGITDNFFDLGGNSLTAVRLFAQIATTFDKNLPLSVLLRANTIKQLAAVIRQDLAPEIWSPLVELQKGSSKQALFCVHGGGFNVLIYRDLTLHLDPDFAVYGLQARGLANDRPLAERLEEIATDYLKEIQRIQPEGPYLLAGLSNGGNIALEMAQQLQAKGQTVALLAMFDSVGPEGVELMSPLPRLLSSLQYALQFSVPRSMAILRQSGLETFATKLKSYWSTYHDKPESVDVPTASDRDTPESVDPPAENCLEREMNRLSSLILQHSPWSSYSPSAQLQASNDRVSNTLKQMEKSYHKVYKSYVPQSYAGKITLFRAMEFLPGYRRDPQLGWGKIAQEGVDVYHIPGHHTAIMESPILSKTMRTCIEKAIENCSI